MSDMDYTVCYMRQERCKGQPNNFLMQSERVQRNGRQKLSPQGTGFSGMVPGEVPVRLQEQELKRNQKYCVMLYFAIVVLFLLTIMLCLVTSPNADNEPVLEKS